MDSSVDGQPGTIPRTARAIIEREIVLIGAVVGPAERHDQVQDFTVQFDRRRDDDVLANVRL